MPELPEVEVTRRGIVPHILGRTIQSVTIRNASLRWPVSSSLLDILPGSEIQTIGRRGKFILLQCRGERTRGTLLIHLGMTGTLRVVSRGTALRRHDHVDIDVGQGILRYHDPRRFGAILWHDENEGPLEQNRHLVDLGVEPLIGRWDREDLGRFLYAATRNLRGSIKQILLGGAIVVGVGNIYASECLFRARIHPARSAGRIGLARYQALAESIRFILARAIERGGSTLNDFVGSDGQPGYFQQEYFVYERAELPCRLCSTPIRQIRQGQRSTYYCPECQRN